MFNILTYQQFWDSLPWDERKLLTGLAYLYAGVTKPISPLSSDFAIAYGIKDAKAARNSLVTKRIIDDQHEIADREFRSWIWKVIFRGIGVPPKPARMYKPALPKL